MEHILVTDEEGLEKLYLDLIHQTMVGFDTETTGTRRWHDTMVGFSFCPGPHAAYYVPLVHEYGTNAPVAAALQLLREIVLNIPLAIHNAAFDNIMVARVLQEGVTFPQDGRIEKPAGIEPIHPMQIKVAHDTHLMAQVIGERSEAGKDTSGALKGLTRRYRGIERPAFNDLFPPKTKKAEKKFWKLDLDIALAYAAADAVDALNLVPIFDPLLDRAQVRKTYEMEMMLLPEVLWTEWHGVAVDDEHCRKMSAECDRFAAEAEAAVKVRLSERLGRPMDDLNLSSPDQLRKLFFEQSPHGLGLPVVKMTQPSKTHPNGQPSTDETTIEKLSVYEPALSWIIEMRGALKAKGTNFDTFATEHAQRDEHGILILHPNYRQLGTETGRTSSDDPNVQNLAKEQRFGANKKGEPTIPGVVPAIVNVRSILRARPGCYLFSADYDQIEYRVIGGLSGDPGLLEVFRQGIDLHKQTYSLMNGVPLEMIEEWMRDEGKTMNYALNFGAGVNRVAGMLGTTKADAEDKINRYVQAYPHVAAWKAQVEEFAKRFKYVETLFGRKRWLVFGGEGVSDDAARKSYFAALREAVNMPVQGLAADLAKIAWIRIGPWLRATYPDVHLILFTHDDFTFEVPDHIDPEIFGEALRPIMEFPAGTLPGFPEISASFSWGPSWGAVKEGGPKLEDHPAGAADVELREHAEQLTILASQPQAIDLMIEGTMSLSQGKQLSQLVASLPGANTLRLNYAGEVVEIPNVAVGPNDGHLFAHIFERFELRASGQTLADLMGVIS